MLDKETITRLKTVYPENKADIELLYQYLNSVDDHVTKELIAEHVEKAQQIVNRLYALKNDGVLISVQECINGYRYEYDITDPREILNYSEGAGYVQ